MIQPPQQDDAPTIIVPSPDPRARLQVLDPLTDLLRTKGVSVPLAVLFDFRSEADFVACYPDAPANIHQFRETLGRDLTILQLHGVGTATAVVDTRSFRAFADEGRLGSEELNDFAGHLVQEESPDVIYASGYPAPAVAVSMADDGAVWAAHLRPPFVLVLISFGSIENPRTERKTATVSFPSLPSMPEIESLPKGLVDRLVNAAAESFTATGISALSRDGKSSKGFDVAVQETPLSFAPPNHLLISSIGDDVRFRAVLRTATPLCFGRLRTDVPELVGVSWVEQPKPEERVTIVAAMHEFVGGRVQFLKEAA
jgi:hypothetical protein